MTYPFEITDVVKTYGTVHALRGVSLRIEPGEVFGLLGPNGAGKTSIISLLTTLEKPTSGEVRVFGMPVGDRVAKTYIGVVPQETISHGFFTVAEVLRFHSGLYGLRNRGDHISFLLDRLGLMAHRDKRVGQLSGGMKRRLLIAKALVHMPKLLLLDEPTAGVDIELRNSLWKFVRELNREHGMTVLLTTHYLEEAEELCARIGVLHHGNLVKVAPTAELVGSVTSKEVVLTLQEQIPTFQHPWLSVQDGTRLVFSVPNQVKLNQLLAETKVPVALIEDVKMHEGTLEDAFLKMVVEK